MARGQRLQLGTAAGAARDRGDARDARPLQQRAGQRQADPIAGAGDEDVRGTVRPRTGQACLASVATPGHYAIRTQADAGHATIAACTRCRPCPHVAGLPTLAGWMLGVPLLLGLSILPEAVGIDHANAPVGLGMGAAIGLL